MRLYGKRFFVNRMDSRISDRKESRDGAVYDIDEANRHCRVRVAGSSTLVRAWFPANFARSPSWLKIDGSVRVAHVGGAKSRIEVVGPGLVRPTYETSPFLSVGADAVLFGMYLTAPIEGTGWIVEISSGTYRINNVTYSFDPGGALLGDDVPLGTDVLMGSGTSVQVIDPMVNPVEPETGLWYRYDAFVIGTDGVVDYLKGEEWEWFRGGAGPIKPSIPVGHVLIRDYVLISSQDTEISQSNIGREWEAVYPHHLEVTYSYAAPAYETTDSYVRPLIFGEDTGVIWGGPDVYVPASEGGPARGAGPQDMEASATVTVVDQYGNPFSWWTSGTINYLSARIIGIPDFGVPNNSLAEGESFYGDVYLGSPLFGGERLMPPSYLAIEGDDLVPNHSIYGWPSTVDLGLGSSGTITVKRQSEYIAQPDPGADGYPGYYQGKSTSKSAIVEVTLVSPDVENPVAPIIVTLFVLDASGHVM